MWLGCRAGGVAWVQGWGVAWVQGWGCGLGVGLGVWLGCRAGGVAWVQGWGVASINKITSYSFCAFSIEKKHSHIQTNYRCAMETDKLSQSVP